MDNRRQRPLVLLVDDDEMMRMLAVEALEGSDFDVIEAGDGAEGILLFVERSPDIVLLDVMMPVVDGYDTCARLRALPNGHSVPILMMTGLDDVDSIDRAYEEGATDFVTKPINYSLLAHRLRYSLRAANAFRNERGHARRLERAQRIAHLAQWELDFDSRQLGWSAGAADALGLSPKAFTGKIEDFVAFVHPADKPRILGAMQKPSPHQLEYRLILPSGAVRVLRQEAEVVFDDESGTTSLIGAAQDVTDLRAAEEQVRTLAYFDSLTGLPNRALLHTYLEHSITEAERDGQRLAVLSLDLDGFKRVNDTLGHAAGDALLREVASRLASSIRSTEAPARSGSASGNESLEGQLASSTMACRLGGDEFVVVLSGIRSADDAATVAQRIADRLAAMFTVSGTEVFISSSIGIACLPDAGTDASTLLERADAAMYSAKEKGRNNIQFFSSNIREKVRRRMDLEAGLRRALARLEASASTAEITASAAPPPISEDHESAQGESKGRSTPHRELRLEYQPKIEIPTGHVVGVEALLRWNSPDLGAVSPAELIPVAEETGLIVALGTWVLRTACAQARAWYDAGSSLRVAVNVSARQFREPRFVETVAAALDAVKLPPSLLELEITEGMLMEDTVASIAVLKDLKRLGLRIALDDFGTGYSSLNYLTRLPIDALKIDRSFIKNLGESGRDATITSAIIALSRGLHIDVIVEGVETNEQLDFVSQHGRAQIQGYLFAKPMSVERLGPWRDAHEETREERFSGRPQAGANAPNALMPLIKPAPSPPRSINPKAA